MASSSTIQYLYHHEIDKRKWDEAIQASVNRLIYGYSFYLDALACEWHALISEDYSWVLPLAWKSKYGIRYLYQPPFTQQLGVFYKKGYNVPYDDIINRVQLKYKFCEAQWNYATETSQQIQQVPKTNFILDLSNNFDQLQQGFSKNLRRNIQRSQKFSLLYRADDDYKKFVEAYRQYYGSRTPHVTEDHYHNFEMVCSNARKHDMLQCRLVLDSEGNAIAYALLLFDGRRLYNMMNTTTRSGRKMEANYFLFNSIIEEFSGQNIILDFEGSDLPGVKAFYENFGAVDQPYFMVRYNHLPWPLRWLKR